MEEEMTENRKQQYQKPPPEPPKSSNTGLIVIGIIALIALFLAFVACSGISSFTTELDTVNTDIDNLQTDVKALDTEVETLSNSIGTISNKTTDLSYLNGVSSFANQLVVNSKNINETLSTMTTANNIVSFSNDVLIKDMNIYNEIVDLNNGSVNVQNLALETLTASVSISSNKSNFKESYYKSSTYNTKNQIKDNSIGCQGSIMPGTGVGADYNTFDLSIYSNRGIGFVNSSAECKIVLDLTNGVINSNTIDLLKNAMFKNSCAGYMLATDTDGQRIIASYPITMSMIYLYPPDIDDIWIVNPGYTFLLYNGVRYTLNGLTTPYVIENTTYETIYVKLFTSSEVITPYAPNQTKSIRVYYKGTEIAPLPNTTSNPVKNPVGNPSTI